MWLELGFSNYWKKFEKIKNIKIKNIKIKNK